MQAPEGRLADSVLESAPGPELASARAWGVAATTAGKLVIAIMRLLGAMYRCERMRGMRITASDIRPGKCFLSQGAKASVVRVLSVHDGVVHFEAKLRPRVWSRRGEAPVPEFVAGLLREVGSDFEPGAGRVHV